MGTELMTFDVRYIELANDRLEGMSMEDLALKYTLPAFRIAEVLELPEVKRYQDSFLQNVGFTSKLRRARLIEQIIEEKIKEMEESEIWSRKDIIEILKVAQDEDKLLTPKTPAVQLNTEVTNNYTSLMKDLFSEEKITEAEVIPE